MAIVEIEVLIAIYPLVGVYSSPPYSMVQCSPLTLPLSPLTTPPCRQNFAVASGERLAGSVHESLYQHVGTEYEYRGAVYTCMAEALKMEMFLYSVYRAKT